MRDHEPIIIEQFNGLWKRGDEETCPLDHFTDCNNIKFSESGFQTRDGIDTFVGKGNVLRMYNYVMQTEQSLLILTEGGDIWHALLDGSNTIYGPILSIPDMTDFAMLSWNGRAYITPFKTFTDGNGHDYQKGLENEFLYVYKGDGTPARKAGGNPPTNGGDSCLVGYNSTIAGVVTEGIHIIGITAWDGANESSDLGPEGLAVIYAPGDFQVNLNNIPLGDVGTTARRIYMTAAIDAEDWNPVGDIRANYTYYRVKQIDDNTTISTIINIADEDLILLPTFSTGGSLPTLTNSPLFLENTDVDGHCDLGLHVVGVVYETDTGFLTAPGPEFFAVQTYVNDQKAIRVNNIPVSPDSFVTKRHLVSTRALEGFNGNNINDQLAYELYFIPDGTIEDNTTTTKEVSYYDSELLEDASYLIDNLAEIPAGVGLANYNNRMAIWTSFTDISLIRFSHPGEPEAFDQVDGYAVVPLNGKPITNGKEFRDVFYVFKMTQCYSLNDNGDLPSTWGEPSPIDLGKGASVHGIAEVLDSTGVNIDFLIICDWSGVNLFTGNFVYPELSWKIEDLWLALERNDFDEIQIINDSINKNLYITLTDATMLHAAYKHGLDTQAIQWTPWSFDIQATTIAMVDTDTVLIGSLGLRI